MRPLLRKSLFGTDLDEILVAVAAVAVCCGAGGAGEAVFPQKQSPHCFATLGLTGNGEQG